MEPYIKNADKYSLSKDGAAFKILIRLNLYHSQKKLVIFAFCLTWLPLFLLTAFEGTVYSGIEFPFIQDVAMQLRILVALPLLILIKPGVDSKVSEVSKQLAHTLLKPEERQEFLDNSFHRAKLLTSSVWTEIILLLLVVISTINLFKGGMYGGMEDEISSWMANFKNGNQELSLAGYWALGISVPIFQLLLLRWIWRYFVWVLLLLGLSRSDLNLLPTHPDGNGGLGNLILVQRKFNLIFFVGSIVISGHFISTLLKHPAEFISLRNEGLGYIVVCLILITLPLLFFIMKLTKAKEDSLLHFSTLGASLSHTFEREWINSHSLERKLDDSKVDPSLLFDFASMYGSLQQLRVIPITIRDLIGMGLMLVVPFTPILFIHFSVGELVQKIVGLLI